MCPRLLSVLSRREFRPPESARKSGATTLWRSLLGTATYTSVCSASSSASSTSIPRYRKCAAAHLRYWGNRFTQVPTTFSVGAWNSIREHPWNLNGNSRPRKPAGITSVSCGGLAVSSVLGAGAPKRGTRAGGCITVRAATCRLPLRRGPSFTALVSQCGFGSKRSGM